MNRNLLHQLLTCQSIPISVQSTWIPVEAACSLEEWMSVTVGGQITVVPIRTIRIIGPMVGARTKGGGFFGGRSQYFVILEEGVLRLYFMPHDRVVHQIVSRWSRPNEFTIDGHHPRR